MLRAGRADHASLHAAFALKSWLVHARGLLFFAAATALAAGGCSQQAATPLFLAAPAPQPGAQPAPAHPQVTVASWYGPGFVGHRTANGEIYDQNALTAASRSLPLGSRVRVTNLANGKSVVVRINDRGPYVKGRGIDLSHYAAARIGLARSGIGTVRITRLDEPSGGSPAYSWSGPVRIRRRRPAHRRAAHRRAGATPRPSTVANPVGQWLFELISPPRHP